MKAEKYLLKHVMQHNISMEQVEKETGIDMQKLKEGHQELMADDFIALCIYLGVNPDEIMEQIV